MALEDAIDWWSQLRAASPHGCRVHLTGGEPFLDWPGLLALCRAAQREGLAPLEKVETSAYWAADPAIARDRIAALADAGMRMLVISADPYHQQFVPIEYARRLASTAVEILGEHRVRVRWRDWLRDGRDTASLDVDARRELLAAYAAGGRERWNGRAAELLAPLVEPKSPSELADENCGPALLRSRHVHVDGAGRVVPGTCAGIILGRLGAGATVASIWRGLSEGATGPVLAALTRGGPVALAHLAGRVGFVPRPAYAGKCELCWHVRTFLSAAGGFEDELGPTRLYAAADEDGPVA
jgi:hypothetical protein